jgi:hypothetical protein
MRRATLLPTVLLSLSLGGCWFGKKTPANIPPPPTPQQPKSLPPELKPQPQPAEQKLPEEKPPELPTPTPPQPNWPPQITVPAPRNIPKPKPPAKKRAPPAPQPSPPAEQPPAQPSPPPQLGEILSDGQRRQYEAEYAQSLTRARSALQQSSGKSLSRAQMETVERIKTFIQQAEESKGKDLATALQLVRRADVLGQDLLKGFL